MLNWQQIYLYGWIQTSQTGGQLYSDTVRVLWINSLFNRVVLYCEQLLPVQHPLEALLRLDRPLAVPDLGRRGDLEDSHQHEQDVRHLVHLKLEDLLQHFAVAVG